MFSSGVFLFFFSENDSRLDTVQELLKAEKEYCKSLRGILDTYAEPLRWVIHKEDLYYEFDLIILLNFLFHFKVLLCITKPTSALFVSGTFFGTGCFGILIYKTFVHIISGNSRPLPTRTTGYCSWDWNPSSHSVTCWPPRYVDNSICLQLVSVK